MKKYFNIMICYLLALFLLNNFYNENIKPMYISILIILTKCILAIIVFFLFLEESEHSNYFTQNLTTSNDNRIHIVIFRL